MADGNSGLAVGPSKGVVVSTGSTYDSQESLRQFRNDVVREKTHRCPILLASTLSHLLKLPNGSHYA